MADTPQNLTSWLMLAGDASTQVARLDELCGWKLGEILQRGWDTLVASAAVSGGAVIGSLHHRGYRGYRCEVRAQLATTEGRYTLVGSCDMCQTSALCAHKALVVAYAVARSSDAAMKIMSSPSRLAEGTLSKDAREFLALLPNAQGQTLAATPAAAAERERFTCYVLSARAHGICPELTIESRSFKKNGEFAKQRGAEPTWSELMEDASPPRHQYQFHAAARSIFDEQDRAIGRRVYVAAATDSGSVLTLGGTQTTDILFEIAKCKRLYLRIEDTLKPLQSTHETRKAEVQWVREGEAGWALGINVQGVAYCVPTDPPMYVDPVTLVFGPVAGFFPAGLLSLIGRCRSLKDEDIASLRKGNHLQRLGVTSIPEPPAVEIIQGGTLTPVVHLELWWAYESGTDRGSYSLHSMNGDTYGIAIARIRFEYMGKLQGLEEDLPESFMKVEGLRKTIYTRDVQSESEAYMLAAAVPGRPDHYQGEIRIVRGNHSHQHVAQVVRRYHDRVVPEALRRGWKVKFVGDWQAARIDGNEMNLAVAKPARSPKSGAHDYEVQASIEADGRSVDLIPLLQRAFSNPAVLRSLNEAKHAGWSIRDDHGYVVSFSTERLRQLLPLVLALVEDKGSKVPMLRRAHAGALGLAAAGKEVLGAEDLLEVVRRITDIPEVLSTQLEGSLVAPARAYQVHGTNWITARRQVGYGCIVADEYAVGKTLQTLLTIFDAANEADGKGLPSLVVVSKTLMADDQYMKGRWQEDVAKFLPTMRIMEIRGTRQVSRLSERGDVHAVLTTYDNLARNASAFKELPWNVVACDEGHKLGNPNSRFHKVVDELQARQKIVITGSSMQNSVRELWALMNLVVPGLLRDRAWFNRTFPRIAIARQAIEDDETEDKMDPAVRQARLVALGKIVGPFYLRRTNDELGRQLPTVIEAPRAPVMGSIQGDHYEVLRVSGQKASREAVARNGGSAIVSGVLPHINRLRQVTCDPRLVDLPGTDWESVPSARREELAEVCAELAGDGKQVLLVSYWVKMLEFVAKDLEEAGYTCAVVHGKSTTRARSKYIAQFKAGTIQFLLMQTSLAEGIETPEGDAIVICEPWWNREKENQAIARLRRNESNKHVTVVRIVMRGTVETVVTRVAQLKVEDVQAVHQGQVEGAGRVTLADFEEFFKPVEVAPMDD